MMPACSAAAGLGLPRHPSFRKCSCRARGRRPTAVFSYQPASAENAHSRQQHFAQPQLAPQHAETHASDSKWLDEPTASQEALQR